VAEVDGRVVGRADVEQTANAVGNETTALIGIYVLPAYRNRGIGSSLYETANAAALEKGLTGRRAWYREDSEGALGFLEARGFARQLRTREYVLDGLTASGSGEPVPESPRQIEFASGREMAWTDELWRELFGLETAINRDVPYPEDEYTAIDVNQFISQRTGATDFIRDGYLLARSQGEPVGSLSLWYLGNRSTASIGLVGVLPKFRKKGIARRFDRHVYR